MLDVQEGKKKKARAPGDTSLVALAPPELVAQTGRGGGSGSFNANSVNLALKMVEYPMVQFARWEEEPTLCTCNETRAPVRKHGHHGLQNVTRAEVQVPRGSLDRGLQQEKGPGAFQTLKTVSCVYVEMLGWGKAFAISTSLGDCC